MIQRIIKKAKDPMTQTSASNIMGDVFLILSGVDYGNIIRIIAAGLGLASHLFFGLRGQASRVFGVPTPQFVMGIVVLCGVLYMISGSNIFGYESGPRYTEVIVGFFITIGSLAVILHKAKIARFLYMSATVFSLTIAVETMLRDGHPDWFILCSSLCFLAANYATGNIRFKESI